MSNAPYATKSYNSHAQPLCGCVCWPHLWDLVVDGASFFSPQLPWSFGQQIVTQRTKKNYGPQKERENYSKLIEQQTLKMEDHDTIW